MNDTLLVVTPITGGPSEKVGILAGDRIVTIDDENVAGIGLTNQMVFDRLKGKKGTKVETANAVGKILAEKANKAGIEICGFDRNGFLYHGRLKALAEGAREGGLKF